MAYTSWSVVANEQPSASKWNILGTNDASFNDGTGIGTNAIAAASLATTAITLGYAQITSNFTTTNTTATQITSLTSSVTIPAGSRRIKITGFTRALYTGTVNVRANLTIWDGTVGSGTQLAQGTGFYTASGSATSVGIAIAVVSPAAGSKTYNLGLHAEGASTANFEAGATFPGFILVEAI